MDMVEDANSQHDPQSLTEDIKKLLIRWGKSKEMAQSLWIVRSDRFSFLRHTSLLRGTRRVVGGTENNTPLPNNASGLEVDKMPAFLASFCALLIDNINLIDPELQQRDRLHAGSADYHSLPHSSYPAITSTWSLVWLQTYLANRLAAWRKISCSLAPLCSNVAAKHVS